MSTEQEHARLIAERIARRVSASQPSSALPASSVNVSAELASVRASLSELQKKLARLEAQVGGDTSDYASDSNYSLASRSEGRSESRLERPGPLTHSPWLAGVNANAAHPSEEKFGVEEAAVSELVDFFEKEKICSLEPGGKPCDHCAMCSARGF